jgi:hypothetical protein
MKVNWICVYSGNHAYSIEIIKAVLKDQEIESAIIDKRDSINIGVGDIELYVPADDAILAKIIIEQLEL